MQGVIGWFRARVRWVVAGVGLMVSALFLWLAVLTADLGAAWDILDTTRGWDVAGAVAAMGGVYVLQALRWRLVARGRAAPQRYAGLVVAGVAANNVLPGRVGDGLRAVWLARAERVSVGRALATVVFDRGADVVTLFGLLAVATPFTVRPTWFVRILIGGALLIALLAGVVAVARLVSRVHGRSERSRSRVRRVARDALDALATPPTPLRLLGALALSVAAWSVWSVAAWLVASSVGIHLSVLDAVLVAGVVNLGVAIPSSPGFIGTYQWLCVSALGLVGVGRTPALAFSILLHAAWYVPTTLVGGAMLVWRLFPARRRNLTSLSSGMDAAVRGLPRQAAP